MKTLYFILWVSNGFGRIGKGIDWITAPFKKIPPILLATIVSFLCIFSGSAIFAWVSGYYQNNEPHPLYAKVMTIVISFITILFLIALFGKKRSDFKKEITGQ